MIAFHYNKEFSKGFYLKKYLCLFFYYKDRIRKCLCNSEVAATTIDSWKMISLFWKGLCYVVVRSLRIGNVIVFWLIYRGRVLGGYTQALWIEQINEYFQIVYPWWVRLTYVLLIVRLIRIVRCAKIWTSLCLSV